MSVEVGDLPAYGWVRLVGCCGRHGGSFGFESGPAEHRSQLSRSLFVGFDLEWMAFLIGRVCRCRWPMPAAVPGSSPR